MKIVPKLVATFRSPTASFMRLVITWCWARSLTLSTFWCWARSHWSFGHVRNKSTSHVTTSRMKLAVGERNVATNLGTIFRLCWRILF